jgi:hypothetical protein
VIVSSRSGAALDDRQAPLDLFHVEDKRPIAAATT